MGGRYGLQTQDINIALTSVGLLVRKSRKEGRKEGGRGLEGRGGRRERKGGRKGGREGCYHFSLLSGPSSTVLYSALNFATHFQLFALKY